MTVNRIRLVPLAALLTAAPALTGLASAQVPDGAAVICTHTNPGGLYISGTPGLFLAPLGGGPLTTVTGLPAELTTDSLGAWGQGAYCVSIRSADGAVIVSTVSGPLAPSAGVIKLWVFYLNGAAVDPARTQQIVLGTATIVGYSFHRVLPDGRILVVAADATMALTTGPMAGSVVGIVDTSGATPTVTKLPDPVTTTTHFGLMAIAPSGDAVYFVESSGFYTSPTDAYVRRYDLTTYSTSLVATLNGESAIGIACDDDCTIYVSTTNPTTSTHSIYSVVPGNPATVTAVQSSFPLLAWGLDLDRASGRFAAGSHPAPFPGPQSNAVSLIDPVTGAATVVASAPAGGWGSLGRQGMAVNNAIESYGKSSDGVNRHWFANFPNPGGQPTVGNLGFSLTTMSAPTAPVLSVLGLSLGRGSLQAAGICVLLDLNTTLMVVVPASTSATTALPIPANPSLAGLEITAQSVHLETTASLTASRGLTFTVQ